MQSVPASNWLDLSEGIWINVVSNFKSNDFLSFSYCCKKFYQITSNQTYLLQIIQCRVYLLLQNLDDPDFKICASVKFGERLIQQENRLEGLKLLQQAEGLLSAITDEDSKELGHLTLIGGWLCAQDVKQAEEHLKEIKEEELQIKGLFAIAEHKAVEESAELYHEIERLSDQIKDVKERFLILIQLGERLREPVFFERAKKVISSIKNLSIRGALYFRLASSYGKFSLHRDQQAIVGTALKLLPKIKNFKARAIFFLNMSTYQIRSGSAEAAASLNTALGIINRLENPCEESRLYNKVAKKQHVLCLETDAFENIKKAVDLLSDIKKLHDNYQTRTKVIKGLILQNKIREAVCLALDLNPRFQIKALLSMH